MAGPSSETLPQEISAGWSLARIKLTLAAAGSAAFAFPLLVALWYHASPLTVANESIAYRFLLSERILSGEGGSVGTWQGFLTSALETTILGLINIFCRLPSNDLEGRIQLYAYSYLTLVTAGGVTVLFAAARSRLIDARNMALLVLAAAGPVFLTRMSGFYYFALPDYYILDVLLGVISLFLFQLEWTAGAGDPPNSRGPGWAIAGGLIVGFMTSNKVTMLVVAALPLVPWFLRSPPLKWRNFVRYATLAATSAFIGFFFVILWLYRFRVSAVAHFLPTWFKSMKTPGGESDFWSTGFRMHLSTYSYGYLMALFVYAIIAAAIWRQEDQKSGRHYLTLGALLLAGLAWAYFLSKRPAGTTFFEAAVSWLTIGCMALSLLRRSRPAVFIVPAIFVIAVATAAASFQFRHNVDVLRHSAPAAEKRWRLERELLDFAGNRPIVVVLPDNEYTYGGITEFLLKGTADFPSWVVSGNGRPTLEHYVPGMTFRSEYTHDLDSPYPAASVVFWVDHANMAPIALKSPQLQELEERRDLRRKDWTIVTDDGQPALQARAIETPAAKPKRK